MTYDEDGNPILTEEDMSWGVADDEAEEERAITILEPNHRIELSDLGTSPKRIYNAAVTLGWDVRAWMTLTRVAPVLFKHDSREDAKRPHLAGDVRFVGFESRNYAVEAKHPEGMLGFRAHWVGTSKDKSPTSATFMYAWVRDPVGVPVENYFEYKVPQLTRHKDETERGFNQRMRQAEETAARQNRIFNDGSFRNEIIHCFTQAGPFDQWLDDWLALAGAPTISRKKPATKAEKNEAALLEGGTWSG